MIRTPPHVFASHSCKCLCVLVCDPQTVTDMGPIRWMAPESLSTEHRYSPASDVYSFAVRRPLHGALCVRCRLTCCTACSQMCLYELFTGGEDPFVGSSNYEAASLVLAGRTWEALAPRLPPAMPRLRALAQACWSSDAAARPSMQAVHEVLKTAAAEDEAAGAAAGGLAEAYGVIGGPAHVSS